MSQELQTVSQEVGAVTPMNVINLAVKQGANVEQLQKLFELQLAYEKNEARKSFVVALTDFKKNAPEILKTKTVSYGQGKTGYKHALAGESSEKIGEALAQHGLSHRWDVEQAEGGIIKVTCVLTHAQGHSERVTLQATPDTSGSKNSIQAIGSTVSYLQRYSLFAATGIVPKDADDDGHQHAVGMPESQVKDFEAAIEALTDQAAAGELWKKILAAAKHDVPNYEELKKKMLAKKKVLA